MWWGRNIFQKANSHSRSCWRILRKYAVWRTASPSAGLKKTNKLILDVSVSRKKQAVPIARQAVETTRGSSLGVRRDELVSGDEAEWPLEIPATPEGEAGLESTLSTVDEDGGWIGDNCEYKLGDKAGGSRMSSKSVKNRECSALIACRTNKFQSPEVNMAKKVSQLRPSHWRKWRE